MSPKPTTAEDAVACVDVQLTLSLCLDYQTLAAMSPAKRLAAVVEMVQTRLAAEGAAVHLDHAEHYTTDPGPGSLPLLPIGDMP
jgi:hypothetical protein